MADSTWSVQDAKNRFSSVVEAAQSEPQTITKHGKPKAVLLGVEEYDRLRRKKRKARNFIEHLLAMPQDDGEFERPKIKPRNVEF